MIGKIGFARWPKGRLASASRRSGTGASRSTPRSTKSEARDMAVHQWAASAETQARTSWKFAGPAKRSGVNRTSLWRSPEFNGMMKDIGHNFVDAALESLEQDTDVELAAAHSAVARDRRHDGHRDSVGAGRAEEIEGSTRRSAGAHRPDIEELMNRARCCLRRRGAAPRLRRERRWSSSVRTLAQQERRFALALFLPALLALIVTTTTPLVYLAWTSAHAHRSVNAVDPASRASTTTPRWAATRGSGIR